MRYVNKGLPWHSGIGTDVSNCETSKEVMQKAKLDFTISKCELVAQMPFRVNANNDLDENAGDFIKDGMIYRSCPNAFATYRTDINVPLGIVKDKYEVVQNVDAFNFFDDAIGEGKAIWDRAGCFGHGHKLFVSAKLPIQTKVGKDDYIDNYLVFSNSHDGSSSVTIMFTPIRIICTNMLNGALKNNENYIKIRHTQSAGERLQRGAEILRIACKHAKNAELIYQSLSTIQMTDAEVMDYIAKLNLTEDEYAALTYGKDNLQYVLNKLYQKDYTTMESANISTRKANNIISMFEYYQDGIGQKEIVGTGWGAYNAVTGYYSNVANLSGEKRVDSLLWGNANRKMNEALISLAV